MIIRFILLCLGLVLIPFAIIVSIVFLLVVYVLIKLNIIKTPFGAFKKMHDLKETMQRKKSFTEATLRQFSCRHQNLEQQNDILICSDCGKIIANGS